MAGHGGKCEGGGCGNSSCDDKAALYPSYCQTPGTTFTLLLIANVFFGAKTFADRKAVTTVSVVVIVFALYYNYHLYVVAYTLLTRSSS